MSRNNERLRSMKSCDTVMTMLWVGFILCGLLLVGILIFKTVTFQDDGKFDPRLRPREQVEKLIPARGDILDCKGRILATSVMVFDIFMDTKVVADTLWGNNIDALSQNLADLFGNRTAAEYKAHLTRGRKAGSQYWPIKKNISLEDIRTVRRMPIFNAGQFKGGYMEKVHYERIYPYGEAAYRVIGYVKDNNDTTTRKIGLEGSFDDVLHGNNGCQVKRRSDFGMIPIQDQRNKPDEDGTTIRTTIDIDIQNITETALSEAVQRSELIEKSCVILLETKTGAVRAMTNLGRDSKGKIGPWENYALRTAESPGSVFKGAVVTALLEDGYMTSIEQSVPTYDGKFSFKGHELPTDTKHLGRHRFPSGYIKVREAFQMSANNTFMQLICNDRTYGRNNMRFIRKIRGFGLLDTLDFDIKGCTPPFILDTTMTTKGLKGFWDKGTFPRMAIGYGMEISALNLVTFYNAIANGGKQMKPYLVDAFIRDGKVIQQFEPKVLRESICTKATADTLKRAMMCVTQNPGGTAYWQMKGVLCPVAGKTGTAQRLFRGSNGRMVLHDKATNMESQQSSFVGFFPADDPKYTCIVILWTKPASVNFYGASYAAPVFREIVDKVYCLDEN